ncbi:MAG TPA: aminomethyltransferase family protein, partial [Kiloniellaceae bacterium]|nr:aminomethyltransferase family protein [Kiloniellaceae bacterium]
GTLTLMGPRSRELLQGLVAEDLSNEAFPFGRCRELTLAGRKVRALRVTFVGELGWELHMPIAATGDVYDAIMAAGAPFGIANAGYRALETLRLEKGYRVWGAEITPSDSPFDAGLGWAVKLKTNLPFLGREAAGAAATGPRPKRLACFTVDDPAVVLQGRETIFRDGKPVGWLASAGWGYTVGKNIGYGYVRNAAGVDLDHLKSGSYALEVACEEVPCRLQLKTLYDPTMSRVKA